MTTLTASSTDTTLLRFIEAPPGSASFYDGAKTPAGGAPAGVFDEDRLHLSGSPP
jgi:hypothetical protein